MSGNQWSNKTLMREVATLAGQCGIVGVTWREVGDAFSVHHGTASGALSLLHKRGDIRRLRERRGGSRIYVTPDNVAARVTESYGRTHECPNCGVIS